MKTIEKINRKKSNYVAFAIWYIFTLLIACWCIDVSVSAIVSGGYLANGFFNLSGIVGYHVGLYMILLSSASFVMVFSHWVIMGRKEKK